MVISVKVHTLRFFFGSLFAAGLLLLNGCSNKPGFSVLFEQESQTSRAQVLQQLRCGKRIISQQEELTPPTLYQEMNQCVEQDNYRTATLLFSLAGSYSWYDAARVDTPLALSQHSELLADALDQLGGEKREILWGHIQSVLGSPPQLKAVCQKIRLIGRPKYQANYIQKSVSRKGYPNARQRWNMALESYLHCPSNV